MTVPPTLQDRPPPWLWAPFFAFTLIFGALSLRTAINLAVEPWPLTPWESAITVDAWRLNHHLTVYEDPVAGHATHMYGPLTTVAAAIGERIFGVDVRVPRALSLAASLLAAVAAGLLLGADRSLPIRLVIAGVAYLQFYRVAEWSTDARPDAESILISLLALAALFRAECASTRRRALAWNFAGSAGLIVAFCFKQPSIVLCVVPMILALTRRRSDMTQTCGRFARALLPIGVAATALIALRVALPWCWFYMITVPASYPVPAATLAKASFEGLELNLLFLFSVGWLLGSGDIPAGDSSNSRIDRWLLATLCVTLPFGLLARSKIGGGHNSLLPALLTMGVFAVRTLDRAWQTSAGRSKGMLVALALLPPLLFWSDLSIDMRVLLPGKSPMLVQHGDANYETVIRAAATLPGRVVSIDDPTIALLAKGYACRSGDCELDANQRQLPQYVIDGLKNADWIIQTKSSRRSTVGDDVLQSLGLRPAKWKVSARADYALWHRDEPAEPK